MGDDILKLIDLTESEIQIYKVLMTTSQMTASELSQKTNLNRSNLYRLLDNLVEKGLVHSVIQNKVNFFSITRLERIKELYDKKFLDFTLKEKKIEKFIKDNKDKGQSEDPLFSVEVYNGVDEIRTKMIGVLNLKKNETIYAFGKEGVLSVYPGLKFWLEKLIKKRVQKGIEFKAVFNNHEKARVADSKLTVIKYMDLEDMGNLHIATYGEITNIYITEGKEPKVVSIKNETISKGMKQYFNLLYEKATPINIQKG